MGLDMYLKSKVYLAHYPDMIEHGGMWAEDFPKAQAVMELAGLKSEVGGSVGVSVTVAYWRKANEIHRWFVDNVQGGEDECQESYVEPEQLESLIATCEEVLADHSLAAELLPTQEGFFFGGTEYDDWYFKDLEDTVRMLKAALENRAEYSDFYYQASW